MVVVEVSRKAYLASLVPVIVNSILNEHQVVVDIVAFVQKGDFPRSRLGEKQRGKILAGWVSRKMRTIAQFAIRDTSTNLGGNDGDTPPDGHRASYSSFRSSSGAQIGLAAVGSTLRNVEPAPQILEQRELEQQLERISALPPEEMRASSARGGSSGEGDFNANARDEMTPTGPRAPHNEQHGYDLADFNQFDRDDMPPSIGPKPMQQQQQQQQQRQTPEIRLPGFQDDGGPMVDWRGHAVPQQGSLHHTRNSSIQHDEDWAAEAMAGMNLVDQNQIGRGY